MKKTFACGRLLLLAVALLAMCVVQGAQAGAIGMTPYPVASGGFTAIEAEDFNDAFDTTTGNQGLSPWRPDFPNVDIEAQATASYGKNINHISPLDSTSYNVQMSAGTYIVSVRVASEFGYGFINMYVDGVLISANVDVPSTGSFSEWTTITLGVHSFSSGTHVVKIEGGTEGGFNFDQIYFNGRTFTLGSGVLTLEAEDFSGATDTTGGNSGGSTYRSVDAPDVDIEEPVSASASRSIGWVDFGDSWTYTITVTTANTYQFKFRVATSSSTAGPMHVNIVGGESRVGGGSFSIPDHLVTGWYSWHEITLPELVSLPAGVVQIQVVGGARVNFDRFTIGAATPPTDPPAADTQNPSISLIAGVQGQSFAEGVWIALGAIATDAVGLQKVDFYVDSNLVGTREVATGTNVVSGTFYYRYSTRVAGAHSFFARAFDNAGNQATTGSVTFTIVAAVGVPVAYIVPSLGTLKIEAENFNDAQDETMDNQGDSGFRQPEFNDTDIQYGASSSNGLHIGWMFSDDRLEYDVSVTTAGDYNFTFRVSAQDTSTTFDMMDSVAMSTLGTQSDLMGPMTTPVTGDWFSFTDVTISVPSVAAGAHTFTFIPTDDGLMNFDCFTITYWRPATIPPPPMVPPETDLPSAVTITSPTDMSGAFTSTSFPVVCDCSDAGSGVGSVAFTANLNGGGAVPITGSPQAGGGGNTETHQVTYTAGGTDGTVVFICSCTDVQGNGPVASSSVTVTLTTPTDGTPCGNGPSAANMRAPCDGATPTVPSCPQTTFAYEAEWFNVGTSGVAWFDTTAGLETGSVSWRQADAADVDIDQSGGADNGGAIGWIAPTEYWKYTMSFTSSAVYLISVKYASNLNINHQMSVAVDGVKEPQVQLSPTFNWDYYGTPNSPKQIASVAISAGTHTLTFTLETGSINFDSFTVHCA